MREHLRNSKDESCPYGEPPDIEKYQGGEWTINGQPRLEGDPHCQIIMVDADSCASCALNPANQPEREPPSPFLSYIVELENILAAEIPLGDFRLTRLDRRALIAVKTARQKFWDETRPKK